MTEYIEREVLIADLEKSVVISCKTKNMPQVQKILNQFINCIKNQPTVDVIEVRYGRNITEMHPVDEFICSECGFMCEDCTEKVFDEEGDYFYTREYEYEHCPHCGAKMDKE